MRPQTRDIFLTALAMNFLHFEVRFSCSVWILRRDSISCLRVVESSMTAMNHFGDIREVMAMFDKVSNRSRGLRFVSFSGPNCVNYVMSTWSKPPH